MSEHEPVIIRFGETKAEPWDAEAFGFMPPDEAINVRGRKSTRDSCSVAMSLKVPKSAVTIDVVVDGTADDGDTLKIVMGDLSTPDLSGLSSRSLTVMKAFFDSFFDTLIEVATRREKHADKLDPRALDPRDPRLQEDPEIEFHDYIKERVRVNKLEAKKDRRANRRTEYKQKRYAADEQMLEVYREQGLARDDNTEQGTD